MDLKIHYNESTVTLDIQRGAIKPLLRKLDEQEEDYEFDGQEIKVNRQLQYGDLNESTNSPRD